MLMLNRFNFLRSRSYVIWNKMRHIYFILSGRQRRLAQYSIICNNCIGGNLYHYLQLQFKSPTINLQLAPADYIKLIRNLAYYSEIEPEEVAVPPIEKFRKLGGSTIDFPVGKLDDLTIFFQHYKSFEEAKAKWNERKARINYEKLCFIMVDTSCTKQEIEDFLSVPGKKLLVTDNPISASIMPQCTVFMKDKPENKYWFEEDSCDILKRPYYRKFDYAKWLLKD